MSREMAPAISLPSLPRFSAKAWYHALSTLAAAMLAFYVAAAFELDSPGSAITTVLIVSSPLPGMVMSKGVWRLIGTLIGAVLSVLLIALFSQSPPAFVGALAICLGICVYVSSLLRYFRAYAAVLSGYTISIVALPAIDNPDQIFYLATGRIAAVTVGIVCTMLVKGLIVLGVGHRRLSPALEQALIATADFAARALDLEPGLPQQRRAVGAQLHGLDPLIEAAANESAETAQQAPAVRLFVLFLINIVTMASSVRDALEAAPAEGPVATAITPLRDMVRDLLRSLCGTKVFLSASTAGALTAAREAAARLSAELAIDPKPESLDILALAGRLEDIVRELELARDHLVAIERGKTGPTVTPVSYHRDTRAAVINGVRAAVATVLAGAFWIATAWPTGTQMLAILLPMCGLLSTSDDPASASMSFARGITLAVACAAVCQFLLLARVDGFPMFVLAVGPFLVAAALYSQVPKHAGSSVAFLAFFSTVANLRDPMQYDLTAALNVDAAYIMGGLCGALVFRTLWPTDPITTARRLVRRMCDDIADMAERHPPGSLTLWETTMQDRLARLGGRLATSPDRTATVEGGIAAIHIGRGAARAWRMLRNMSLPPETAGRVEAAWRALRRLRAAPDAAPDAARQAAQGLLGSAGNAGSETERAALLRAAAAFHEIALLLVRHRAFFTGALPTVTESA